MSKNDVLVSVCCLTYNHEKYIRDALEGFVNQKTSFSYEVIVHDDASTDSTAKIIQEYEKKYPEIIKPIYQKENQYSRGGGIIRNFVYPQVKGKYVAFCEGDDFWTDPEKLQRQFEALEKNNNCAICINKVERTDVSGKGLGQFHPPVDISEGVIKSRDYLSLVAFPGIFWFLAFQLSGCMVRKDLYSEWLKDKSAFAGAFDVRDTPFFLYMGLKGDAYYINKSMSCYRTGNSESWTGKMNKSKTAIVKHREVMIHGLEVFDEYSDFIVHDAIEKAILNTKFIIYQMKNDLRSMKSKEMMDFYKSCVGQILIFNEESVKKVAQSADKVLIYGTGQFADLCAMCMEEQQINIAGYIVSDEESKKECFRDKEVYRLSEVCAWDSTVNSIGIVIGTSDIYRDEIIERLKNSGFSNYCQGIVKQQDVQE